MMEANSFCQYLEWDSNFFGRRIARITMNRLNQETIEHAMMWCNSQGIDCLYFLGDPDDAVTVRLAEDSGFRFVDIRVTLERQLASISAAGDACSEALLRRCTSDDVQSLRAIAKVSHRDTRFYYDPNFPESLCNALYETWIEKSCNGYADAVFVVELQRRPVGYLSCHLLDQAKGQIGLFGVDANSKDIGLGQSLINESLRWFAEQGVKQVTVATQGRNLKAQRLYHKCGFVPRAVQLWYHRWFLDGGPR